MVQPKRRAAFTLLELVVALIILAAGLLAIQGLMVRQSRQVSHVEQWCATDRTYYVVGQSNPWMQTLGAPADLRDQPGQAAWTPPVMGWKPYHVMLQLLTCSPDGRQLSAGVELAR
jgi:prepilin-type N-terminal cleavage/methylation domain-containing protein